MLQRLLVAGLLLVLVMLPCATPAMAAEGPTLTLPQLIDLALKYSPEIKATKSEVTFAKEQKAEVHGYRWPQVDMTGIGGLVPNSRKPKIVNGLVFFPDPQDRIHGMNVFGRLDFTVIQPIYTFGKIAHREDAAGRNVKVKEAGVELKRGEIIARVAEAYYGLVLAEQGKDAVKEGRTYLNDAKGRVNRLMQVNSPNVKETDLYRLAVYEGNVEKFGAQAEEGAKVAYVALKGLIGYGAGQEFRVPPELPNPASAGPLDQHIRTALELRPEFTQLKEGLAARQLLVDAAKADRLPSFFLAVVGALAGAPGRDPIKGHLRDPAIYDFFNDTSAFPTVGMKWHFDFGILKAKVRQAQAELEQLQHTEKTALMGIPIEVAQAHGKVQENYRGALGLEKAYVNARRWLITAFSNFDIGLGKMEDIFDAFEKYGSSRGDYLMTLYQYNLATAQLAKATGAYRRSLPAEAPAVKPAAAKTK